jgi:hypothetical protein
LLSAQASLNWDPPILSFQQLLRWHAHTSTLSFFSLRWNVTNLSAEAGLNHSPVDLSLLCSWDDKACTTVPSGWLRWSLMSVLPGLALNHNPPDLSFSSSWDYRCESSDQIRVFSSTSYCSL